MDKRTRTHAKKSKASTPAGRARRSNKRPQRKRKPKAQSNIALATLFSAYVPSAYEDSLKTQRSEFLKDLTDAYLRRGLVLYAGAGISQSVGLQSWGGLIRDLTVAMMAERVDSAAQQLGINDGENWEKVRPLHEEVAKGRSDDQPMLVQARAIKDHFGDKAPAWIAATLYGKLGWMVIYDQPEGVEPDPLKHRLVVRTWDNGRIAPPSQLPTSPLIEAIVALARAERRVEGVRAIVNYNFDVLLDEKLREAHVRCVTVTSGSQRVSDTDLPCYHVHGVLAMDGIPMRTSGEHGHRIGNFVFGEDEYHAEYADPYRWSNMTQMSLLGHYTGLFIGLSMTDPDIRRLIEVTHKQYPDRTHYAILTRREMLSGAKSSNKAILRNLYEEVETKSYESLGVRVLWVDRHEDVPDVLRMILKIEQSSTDAERTKDDVAQLPGVKTNAATR